MAGIVDQIKERVDVVDLISSYLKLNKAGVNYKARCPFHNEKSGSFFVSPERQIWHCFGCGLGGDVFGFVKQIEGVEFPEALRILAARAGIELHRQGSDYAGNPDFQNNKTLLLDISELATRFFEKQLWHSEAGRAALAYLYNRGLTEESIRRFRLGWAPDSWHALNEFLQGRYDNANIFDAGLIVRKDAGGYYDRFRSRIMFPVFDLNGQVVGFSGRVFEAAGGLAKQGHGTGQAASANQALPETPSEVAKYVNTPQTAIYDKSRVLYGLHAAKLDIRRQNRCLVVEGNMDVIMSHQAGATHAVASSGTALTDGHLKIIKRYTDNLDLCFDSDNAGELATSRGVDLALARGFNVGIVAINEAGLKDPADYVKVNGAKWADYAQKSRPFMDFFFENAKKSYDISTALGKKLLAQKLVPFLASMVNKIEQSHWVSEIALALKTKEDLIYQEIVAVKPKVLGPEAVADSLPAMSGRPTTVGLDPLEETILSLIIKKPELAQIITPETGELFTQNFNNLLSQLNLANSPETKTPPSAGQTVQGLEVVYLKSQELWNDFQDKELEAELHRLIDQVKRRSVLARLASLEFDIKEAERARDKARLTALVAEFSKISHELLE